MNRANNKCKDCNACKIVYDKGLFMFWTRYYYYYCIVSGKILDDTNSFCEHWQKKEQNYDLSSKRFDKVVKDIEWLMEYSDLNRK